MIIPGRLIPVGLGSLAFQIFQVSYYTLLLRTYFWPNFAFNRFTDHTRKAKVGANIYFYELPILVPVMVSLLL
jgi:hypothetical protein